MTMLIGFAEQPLANDLIHAAGWTLLHFCWQGIVVGIVLWCVLALLNGRSSRVRYAAACLALTLMVLLPLVTFGRLASEARRKASHRPVMNLNITVRADAGDGTAAMPWKERSARLLDLAAPWVPGIWLAGVALFLARLNLGLIVARRMKSVGTQPAALELQLVLQNLAGQIGVQRAVRLMNSAMVQVPTVVGWLRPVVLLPVGCFMGLSQVQVEALLAHELAHIRRHDYLVSVLQSVVEALLFYHPAVWWVSRQVRRERECCCDDLAVGIGGDRLTYAKALSWLEEHRSAMPEIVLGANGGVLKMRIRRLLGTTGTSAGPQMAAGIVLLCMAASAVLFVSAVARAQLVAAVRMVPAVVGVRLAPPPVHEVELVPPPMMSARLVAPSIPGGVPARSMLQVDARQTSEAGAPVGIYKTWLDQDVLWIITADERAEYVRLTSDQERDKFIADFWARRNPTGLSDNPFRTEHYSRIAYTNEHFGTKQRPGWKTDRGHVLISYGKPDSIDSHPTGEESRQNGVSTRTYPFEVWHYRSISGIGDNVDLEFVDVCGCGEYHYTIDRLGKKGPAANLTPNGGEGQSARADQLSLAAKILSPRQVSYRPQGTATQSTTSAARADGSIAGFVMDKTEAVLPGTRITATNTATGAQKTAFTDKSGSYYLSPLPVGTYNVEAVEQGFARQLQENIRVDSGQQVGLNLKLNVGSSQETLTVTGKPTAAQAVQPPDPTPSRPNGPLRVSSGSIAGNLIFRPDPVYPEKAKAARVQGAVVLRARIGKTGAIENLEVISGPMPLLVSAIDAVRQWKYKPYLLNGEPTEVDTTITVNFTFGGLADSPQGADFNHTETTSQLAASSGNTVPKRIGGGVSVPELIKQVDPEFTDQARKASFTGIVLVNLWVDEHGNPTHVHVLRGVGMGLDEKAVEAVRQYKFKPAMEDGKPVLVELNVEVNFQVSDPPVKAQRPAGDLYQVGTVQTMPKKVGNGVSVPVLISSIDPEYTEQARKDKVSGVVKLNFWVDESGKPTHVVVTKGVGHGLDLKAVEAVKQYKFKPALEDGKPVLVELNTEVNFQIF